MSGFAKVAVETILIGRNGLEPTLARTIYVDRDYNRARTYYEVCKKIWHFDGAVTILASGRSETSNLSKKEPYGEIRSGD